MRRRISFRTHFVEIAIRAAIRLADGARRAVPAILLIGVLFAGAAVWLTTSTKASHWVWKGWERMFGPASLTNVSPSIFAQLGGSGNYTIATINDPSAGTSAMEGTIISAVNASGIMTGGWSDAVGVVHGFVDNNGTFTPFEASDAGSSPQPGWFQGTLGTGIDTAGDVVGVYADNSNAYHGFLLLAGSTTPIEFDDPSAPATTSERGTFPMAFNDAGQIVGFYTTCCYNTTSAYYGFLLAAGNFAPGNFTTSTNYTTIMVPDAGTGETANGVKEGTTPMAINASGVVTGYYVDASGNRHGFIYNSATQAYTYPIDPPGATTNTGNGGSFSGTIPMSIDAAGDVVGSFTDSNLVRHGFILPAGSTTAKSFDAPGANTTSQSGTLGGTFPTRIDPTGSYITGSYTDPAGLGHGFVYYLPLTSNAAFTTFTPPNMTTSTSLPIQGGVFGVNASGTVVGFYLDSSEVAHGFEYTSTTIPTPAPTFNPGQGTYGSTQTVAISDANPAATIYYTTDGTTPTTSSTTYTSPITVSSTETIEAIAVASGYGPSSVATAIYALNTAGSTPTPAPQFSPGGGTYATAQTVTITDAVSGASIYYTLDGSVPTSTSTLYTAPVAISASAELQAIAIAPDYAPSDITAASYQITGTASPQYVYNFAGTGQPGYNGDGVPAMQADLGSVANATAVDSEDNLYIADTANNRIRMVNSSTGVISTFAGTGTAGYSGDGGSATAAELNSPSGVAVGPNGDVYIADTGNGLIRVVGSGVISTFAGSVSGGSPLRGCSTNPVQFSLPRSIAFGPGGLYVADQACEVVWVTNGETASVFAGQIESPGFVDDVLATQGKLNQPYSVALDSSENVYIADYENSRVREVTGGVIHTVAGNGSSTVSGDGGSATAAGVPYPSAIAVDSSANLYISSPDSIRIVSGGTISTFVGGGSNPSLNNDGALASENKVFAESLVATNGILGFFDGFGGRVRLVSAPAAAPSTAAATPVISLSSGTYSSAQTVTITDSTPFSTIYFTLDGSTPTGSSPIYHGSIVVTGSSTLNAIAIAPNPGGSGYVASAPASATYTITPAPSSVISTIATAESTVGIANEACFGGVALDSANDLYTIDACGGYPAVFKISAATGNASVIAGNGEFGYGGDGGQAADAEFEFEANSGVVLDSSGNIYLADTSNNRVRVINAQTGIVSTFAGTGTEGYSGDGGAATAAELAYPMGLAFDAQGNLYIADLFNDIVREVNAQTGDISTVAGTPQHGGYSGDNGPATSAYLEEPQSIAVDSSGNLYIADESNRIRKVTRSTGTITTIAGNGNYGATGDGGPALNAPIAPNFLAVDTQDNVYLTNVWAGVREVLASNGTISTVVGDTYRGYWGDGGPPTNAGLKEPTGIAFDSSGDMFVADAGNENIREVTAPVATPTFSPGAGTYNSAEQVTISSTAGASIYYTTNGDTPTPNSAVYSGPITVSSSETLQAIAVLGYNSSAVGFAAYTINPLATAPQVTVSPGASSVTTTQQLQVTVTVSGSSGNPAPTGSVVLSGGGYSSSSAALSGGSATITIPAGTLTAASYTFQASYTPDTNSSPIYTSASGTAASPVTVSLTAPIITWTPASTVIYGSTGSNVLNASANTSGSFTYSATPAAGGSPINITAGTSALEAGSYNITATFTPTDTGIYSSAQSTATLVVIEESVLIVDAAGGVSALTGSGAGITSSANPGANLAVAIDSLGNAWTVGSGTTLLTETSQAGTSLQTIPAGTGGLISPTAIAIDGNGQVWVTNGNDSVSLFSNAGTALSPATGFTDTSLSAPSGIAIDLSGSVWIANMGNNSVTRILGAAAPVAPLATAAANKTTGEKP